MANVPTAPRHVQVSFTFLHGPVIREDMRTRPATLDEIEQRFGQRAVDRMMEATGAYIDVSDEAISTAAVIARGNGAIMDRVTALFDAAADPKRTA